MFLRGDHLSYRTRYTHRGICTALLCTVPTPAEKLYKGRQADEFISSILGWGYAQQDMKDGIY